MKYEELNIMAKLFCIREYVSEIVPYEDLDDVPVGDIEYDITETLKASKELTIDQSGKWFYEGRRV